MLQKKRSIIFTSYYPFTIKKVLYTLNLYNTPKNTLKKIKHKKNYNISLFKIPKLLIKNKKQYLMQAELTIIEQYIKKIFFTVKQGWKYYFITKKAINTTWQIIKKIKQHHKILKIFESRKLYQLNSFYRNFGFRKSQGRTERTLTRTKKFKKYKLYDQILKISRHKTKLNNNYNFPIQSCRIAGPSYYKIKEQLFCYWQRNYFSDNFTTKKLSCVSNKFMKYKKKRLIKFISKIELTLNALLLRTRLLKTIGLVNQFIKHGNIFVNYKKIYYPAYNIKPGDTISIYINTLNQKYHRFHDPLYVHCSMHGLYKKNTGRQSLIAREKQLNFTKSSLNNLNTIYCIPTLQNKMIIHDILPFRAPDRLQKINNYHNNVNNTSIMNWKFGFLSKTIPDYFIQQNKYIDYINNNLA